MEKTARKRVTSPAHRSHTAWIRAGKPKNWIWDAKLKRGHRLTAREIEERKKRQNEKRPSCRDPHVLRVKLNNKLRGRQR